MTTLSATACLILAAVWMLGGWVFETCGQGGGSDLVSAALSGLLLTAAGCGLLLWRQPSRTALAAMAPIGGLHLLQMGLAANAAWQVAVLGRPAWSCGGEAPVSLLWLVHGLLFGWAAATVVGRDLRLRLG